MSQKSPKKHKGFPAHGYTLRTTFDSGIYLPHIWGEIRKLADAVTTAFHEAQRSSTNPQSAFAAPQATHERKLCCREVDRPDGNPVDPPDREYISWVKRIEDMSSLSN